MGTLDPNTEATVDIGTLEVVPQDTVPVVSESLANAKAGNIAFALPSLGDVRTIKDAVYAGQEKSIRETAALQWDAAKQQNFLKLAADIAKRKQGPLTTDEYNTLAEEFIKSNEPTDPNTVVEKGYADRYMSALMAKAKPGTWLGQEVESQPQVVAEEVKKGADFIAIDQHIRKRIAEQEEKIKNESWLTFSDNILKDVLTLGLYSEYQKRNNVPGTPPAFGLGNSIENQRRLLYTMKPEDAAREVDRIVEDMNTGWLGGNPHLAKEFLNSMVNPSGYDTVGANLSTVLTLTGIPGVRKAFETLTSKAVQSTVKDATSVVKQLEFDFGTTDLGIAPLRQLEFDFGPAPAPRPSSDQGSFSFMSETAEQVKMLNAIGDLEGAAVKKTADDFYRKIQGTQNPISQAIEAAPQIVKSVGEGLSSGVGPEYTELANRMRLLADNAATELDKAFDTMTRVQRLPEAIAHEKNAKVLMDVAKSKFKGVNSNIIGQDGLFYHPRTNTLYAEIQIGTEKGTLFDRKDVATIWSVHNGIPIKGFANRPEQLSLMKGIYEFGQARTFVENAIKSIKEPTGALAMHEVSPQRDMLKQMGLTEADLQKELTRIDKETKVLQDKLTALQSMPGATLEVKGNGYYISYMVPIDETHPLTKSIIGTTIDSKDQGTKIPFLRMIRDVIMGGDSLPLDERVNRYITQYTSNILDNIAYAELEDVRRLTKGVLPKTDRAKMVEEWNSVLDFGRTMKDPNTGEIGYLFENFGDLIHHYQWHIGRPPSDLEISAYQAVRRYNAMIRQIENINIYKNKSMQGGQEIQLSVTGSNGRLVGSQSFDASIQDHLPSSEEVVLVAGKDIKGGTMSSHHLPKYVQEGIRDGSFKIFRLLDSERFPLRGFADKNPNNDYITYVISNSAEVRPLSIKQVSARNIIWEHDYAFAVKQAEVMRSKVLNKDVYLRDKVVVPIQNQGMGSQLLKRMEAVRKALHEGNERLAQDLSKHLPWNWEDFKAKFNSTVDAMGREVPAEFRVDIPFQLTRRNIKTLEHDSTLSEIFTRRTPKDARVSTLKDATKRLYTGELDRPVQNMQTVYDTGTAGNPIFQLEPAKYLSPVESINRSMRTLIDSTFLDDYKAFAISHYIDKYKAHIDADPEELNFAPAYYFYKGNLRQGTPFNIQMEAMAHRRKVRELTGQPSTFASAMHWVEHSMASYAYDKLGPKGKILDPSWVIPTLTNADSALRSMAYNSIMGLFNPATWVVNHLTYATIFGAGGTRNAGAGTMAAMVHRWAATNPITLDKLDGLLSKVDVPGMNSFKPGQYKEALKAMVADGFNLVTSRTNSFIETGQPKLVKGPFGTLLDWGNVFMRHSEENVRHGAYYTAYLEWRDKNPTSTFNDKAKRSVLARANDLSGSMTNASKNLLQQGIGAIPTQFLGYSMRMVELVMGSRLTWQQKAKLFGTYYALFGIAPLGFAAYPVDQWVRERLLDAGYKRGESNIAATLLVEGSIATAVGLITGQWLNIGQKGSVGIDAMREAFQGDLGFWKLMSGAAGSSIQNMLYQSDPFVQSIMSITDSEEAKFKLKLKDITDLANVTNTGSNINRWLHAINTGEWITKQGRLVEKDVSPWAASVRALTQLQPQDLVDKARLDDLDRRRKEDLKRVEDQFIRESRNFFSAINQKNDSQADDYKKRMWAILIRNGYPPERLASLRQRAYEENKSIVDRAKVNYYMNLRNIPLQDRQRMLDTAKDIRGMK